MTRANFGGLGDEDMERQYRRATLEREKKFRKMMATFCVLGLEESARFGAWAKPSTTPTINGYCIEVYLMGQVMPHVVFEMGTFNSVSVSIFCEDLLLR